MRPEPISALRSRALLEEVAPGVRRLRSGRLLGESDVYLVASDSSWTLVDAAWPSRAPAIRAAAEALFGPRARPAAILFTHLARAWGAPVHVHPAEVAQAAGGIRPGSENPIDRYVLRRSDRPSCRPRAAPGPPAAGAGPGR